MSPEEGIQAAQWEQDGNFYDDGEDWAQCPHGSCPGERCEECAEQDDE